MLRVYQHSIVYHSELFLCLSGGRSSFLKVFLSVTFVQERERKRVEGTLRQTHYQKRQSRENKAMASQGVSFVVKRKFKLLDRTTNL